MDIFERLRGRHKRRVDDVQHQFIHVVSIRKFLGEIVDRRGYREVFRKFQSFPLTKDQTDAAVSHFKETIVIAGAGSGKTSLLLGRAKYLLDSGRAEPGKILALAFNKAAAEELQDRSANLNLPIKSMTFHGYGNSVLNRDQSRGGVAFADPGKLSNFLQKCFDEIQLSSKAPMLTHYFSEMLIPFRPNEEFENLSEYSASTRSSTPPALSGDYVKSHGEWLIANFLWRNSIDFKYEELFDYSDFPESKHLPDFTVHPPGKNKFYIEYFGIDGEMNTAPWINQDNYLQSIDWKRQQHRRCKTELIEITYQDLKDDQLIQKLSEGLDRQGIILRPRTDQEVLSQANSIGYLSRFVNLCETFLSHSRSKRLTSSQLLSLNPENPRTQTFLRIFCILLEAYERELEVLGLPDFSALIHEAADDLESGEAPFPFDHVLVDEYQDISFDRQRVLNTMMGANPELEILMVGDDWQSINRFAGSDISIMRKTSEPKINRRLIRLGETHRFPQSLADVSSQFVSKNPDQLEKKIVSLNPSTSTDSLFLHWNTEIGQKQNQRSTVNLENLKQVVDFIDQENNSESELLVLARYKNNLPSREELGGIWKGPFEILSIHKSKGLEADYTIVMDVQQDWRGFPSTIEDDPVLDLVLPDQEAYPYAEERRIFYVAMTRARIATHLITPYSDPSLFAEELLQAGKGTHIGLPENSESFCPVCKTGRVVRSTSGKGYFCSNSPDCKIPKPKCSKCNSPTALIAVSPIQYECLKHKAANFETCPMCDYGVLVDRVSTHGPFKSCHMWQATGCKGTKG
jgi:DNA helicase-4